MRPLILVFFLLFFCGISEGGDLKTLILQPGPQNGCDAYINSYYPDEIGTEKGLLVTAWTLGGDAYVGKSLLRFDLSMLSSTDSIVSAKLSLFFDPAGAWPQHEGDNAAHIRRVTEHWDQYSVTWNNQPAVSESDKIYLSPSVLPQQDYSDIDVTSWARLWQKSSDLNNGVMVSLDTQVPYACLVFAPCDRNIATVRPKLVITYTGCAKPLASFDFSVDGYNVGFHDKSSSALIWSWQFGDGQSSTEKNPVHRYELAGDYPVSLTVEDSCGSSSFTDTVSIKCNKPQAGFFYCQNYLDCAFYDTSISGNQLSWRWDFGDGNYSTLKNPQHTYAEQGTYRVCLLVTDACGNDTALTEIALNLPLRGFTVSQDKENDLTAAFVDLQETSTDWVWAFGDGDSSRIQNPVHTYKNYGIFPVYMKNYAQGGFRIYRDTIELKKLEGNTFDVQVFPNPLENGIISLLFSCDVPLAEITFRDLLGNIVYQKQINEIKANVKIALPVHFMSSGVFFLRIKFLSFSKAIKIVIP